MGNNKSRCTYCIAISDLRVKCNERHKICSNCITRLINEYFDKLENKSAKTRYKKYIKKRRIPFRFSFWKLTCFMCENEINVYYVTYLCNTHSDAFQDQQIKVIYTVTRDVTVLCAYSSRDDAEYYVKERIRPNHESIDLSNVRIDRVLLLSTKIKRFDRNEISY